MAKETEQDAEYRARNESQVRRVAANRALFRDEGERVCKRGRSRCSLSLAREIAARRVSFVNTLSRGFTLVRFVRLFVR